MDKKAQSDYRAVMSLPLMHFEGAAEQG